MREDNVRKIWSETELDAALADLNSDVDPGDGLAFARASLLAAAGAGAAPPAGPRRSGAWRWLAVAAAVVTLVGGLGVAAALWTPGPPETSRPAAVLPDVDGPLAPGEYHYTDMRDWVTQSSNGFAAKLQRRIELWIPADPTGVWHRRTTLTGHWADGKTQEPLPGPVDEYGPRGVFAGQHSLTWLTPDAAFVASLVPDRQRLADQLAFDALDIGDLHMGRPHSATEALGMVQSVLELGLLRPDVRFALRDALASYQGIFVVSHWTLPDQRQATVYIAKETGMRLFLDPATAQLLAADGAPTPATIHAKGTAPIPPSSVNLPNTTTTWIPRPPNRPDAPGTQYSYGITRTSG
ncbi:CU044_5270 family protein [Amycolatopsis mediterranei]|uniref:CU044_5270 family protein n=1 Tax=Amycolatopsis mediterranei TaxID=33910 RepID=UPI00361302D6